MQHCVSTRLGTAGEDARDRAGCHKAAITEWTLLLSSQPCCPQQCQPLPSHKPPQQMNKRRMSSISGARSTGMPRRMWLSSVRWGNRGRVCSPSHRAKGMASPRAEVPSCVPRICPSVCSEGVGVTLTPAQGTPQPVTARSVSRSPNYHQNWLAGKSLQL